MTSKNWIFILILVGTFVFVFLMQDHPAQAQETVPAPSPQRVKEGKAIFNAICSVCHGLDGKGDGPVSAYLKVKPRNFTDGIFKFRSTPSGQLPTNADLYRTVTSGVHTTAMPSFKMMAPEDRAKVIDYVKHFSARFSDPKEYPLKPITIGAPVPYTQQSASEGRKIYEQMKCSACHGETGRGDGPSSKNLTDAWNNPIQPRDLTKAHASKLANEVIDIYRTFTTGLDGTPMPSYADSLTDEQRWHLANYIWSLQRKDEFYDWMMPGK